MNSNTKIRVFLADDHTVVRQGLRALLEAEADIEVVGEAETGRQAVELAGQLQPEIVVMDISMPQLNGLEATRQIVHAVPGVKILALSAYDDEEFVRQATETGAAGYLLKQTAAAELIKAVHEVRRGKAVFSPPISKRVLERCRETLRQGASAKPANHLTAREAEVLQLVAEGRANKQIAADLGISIKTVEKHRQQVMNKLNIHDTAGLTRYAVAKGVIECGAPAGHLNPNSESKTSTTNGHE